MAKTNYTEKSNEEIQKQVADLRENLRTFRFGGAGSRSRNVREGATLRHEIARLLTELNKRNASAQSAKLAETQKKA